MAKKPANSGKAWTKEQVKELKEFAKGNTPTGLIAMKMARTATAVQSKATAEGISLKPVNQKPYNRKPKA
jgi:hypothetical protein